jgi:hypothetical protein
MILIHGSLSHLTLLIYNLNTDTLIGTSSDNGKTCTIRAGGEQPTGGGTNLDGLIIGSNTKIEGTCNITGDTTLSKVLTHATTNIPNKLLAVDVSDNVISATIVAATGGNPVTELLGLNTTGEVLKMPATFSGNVVGTSALPQPNEIYWSVNQIMNYGSSSNVTLELGLSNGVNNFLFNCHGRGVFNNELAVGQLETTTSTNPILFQQQVPSQAVSGPAWTLIVEPYTYMHSPGITRYRMVKNGSGNQTFTETITTAGVVLNKGTAPSSATDTGTEGEVRWAEVAGGGGGSSSYYMYVCIATDTWRRQVLDTWSQMPL